MGLEKVHNDFPRLDNQAALTTVMPGEYTYERDN
jgi:hypothetical protein